MAATDNMKRGAAEHEGSTASKRGASSAIDCVILNENTSTCDGHLNIQGLDNSRDFTFLPFETEEVAWEMYSRTTSYDDNLVSCHQVLFHKDKCLLAFKKFETMEQYFTKKMVEWKQSGGSSTDKGSWLKHIEEDFTRLFRDVLRILYEGIDDNRYDSFWANLEECLVVTGNCIKLLPMTKDNKRVGVDLDELQKFMSKMIGLPFGLDDVLSYSDFNMSLEMSSFLFQLSNYNLNFMGPKFLLWPPFAWSDNERCIFIENLEYLLNTFVIRRIEFGRRLAKDQHMSVWFQTVGTKIAGNKTVFSEMIDYPNKSFGVVKSYRTAFDVVRFCANAFRHYNDVSYQHVRVKNLNKINIQKELAAAIPDLIGKVFDAPVLYAEGLGCVWMLTSCFVNVQQEILSIIGKCTSDHELRMETLHVPLLLSHDVRFIFLCRFLHL
ncbi:hypothetical protein V6N11_060655 [Hibiscus sabdariffa]|uniref:Uncharacterized protein n=1 Tax=Hibiscus sabdariffa TaxID=183260 RepID=A0ABR2QR04_9ROSI